jgi:AcrR family transcriptional regulator
MNRKKGQRGPGRRKREERVTPEKILPTAIELFARQGFMSTSMQNIADELGVSQSLVMYHFPNRIRLFEACIAWVQGRNKAIVEATLRPEDDALTRLRKHFHANLKWAVEAPEEAQVVVLLYYIAAYDPDFATLNDKVLGVAREKILACLMAARREKLIAPGQDTETVAEILHDILMGGILNWLTTRKASRVKRAPVDALHAKWEEAVRKLLGASWSADG